MTFKYQSPGDYLTETDNQSCDDDLIRRRLRYLTPQIECLSSNLSQTVLLSASKEELDDGGLGKDDDDPDAKIRMAEENEKNTSWGDIW